MAFVLNWNKIKEVAGYFFNVLFLTGRAKIENMQGYTNFRIPK